MQVEVEWHAIGPRSERLKWTRCLYAYTDFSADEVVYIGKADVKTVSQRFHAPDKDALFDFLEREHGITQVGISVGDILADEGTRLTRQLLADIESLLIKRMQPIGNVTAKRSRIGRPGLVVVCSGDWPHQRSRFRDVA